MAFFGAYFSLPDFNLFSLNSGLKIKCNFLKLINLELSVFEVIALMVQNGN